jgi:hypothetical protein
VKAFRRIVVLGLAVLGLLAFAGSASAAVRGVVLNAPKSVTVDYVHCADPSGNPLPCINVNGGVYNNDGQVYSCQVVLNELNFVVMNTPIAPGQSIQWNVSTPYTGQSYLTFTLYCNGAPVPGQTDRVRVLQA